MVAEHGDRRIITHCAARSMPVNAFEKFNNGPGFATGGMIHPGDTQKVDAWKRPDEAVGFFLPEQRKAVGDAIKGSNTKVSFGNIVINMPPGTQMSPRATQEIADRFRQAVRAEMGGL